MKNEKFYSLDKVKKTNADFCLIFGKRSNGKSYACLREIVEQYAAGHGEGAIIRRQDEDIRGKYASTVFDPLILNGVITKATAGEWVGVHYKSGEFRFCREEDGKTVMGPRFCRAFSISGAEHAKSSSYPEVRTILFDEFITRDYYLPNEFVKFLNLLSTIIRGRTDVRIYMCGNTVSYDAPYFKGMGIDKIKNMKIGELRVYEDEKTGRRIAVHYADATGGTEKANKFFSFDDPRTRMITEGEWELNDWQAVKWRAHYSVAFRFFIEYGGEFLNCEVITDDDGRRYIKVSTKRDPVRYDSDLCFTDHPNGSPLRPKLITSAVTGDPVGDTIAMIQDFFKIHAVFYTSPEAGEILRNYVAWCRAEKLESGY